MLQEGGASAGERVAWLFRTVAGRKPNAKEEPILARLLEEQLALFTSEPEAAEKLLKVGATPCDAALDKIELAAGTVLANALLNHDEAVMRR
jgi:hypothetical protein